jgi:hypothetical protein
MSDTRLKSACLGALPAFQLQAACLLQDVVSDQVAHNNIAASTGIRRKCLRAARMMQAPAWFTRLRALTCLPLLRLASSHPLVVRHPQVDPTSGLITSHVDTWDAVTNNSFPSAEGIALVVKQVCATTGDGETGGL